MFAKKVQKNTVEKTKNMKACKNFNNCIVLYRAKERICSETELIINSSGTVWLVL